MDKTKIGNYLTELRKQKNLSQADLADLIGVTFQAVSKWERGEAIPDIATLEQLSIFYGITIDEIIKGGEVEKVQMTESKPITPPTNSFLNQKRIYGFWISIGFLGLYLLLGFCPYLNIGANYYQLIFSSNFLIGNFFYLLQFFIVISVPIITMCFSACSNATSFKKLYFARFILTILMLVSLLTNLYYFEFISVGEVLLMILMIVYSILIFSLKILKKKFLIQDFTNFQE